jgi:hypothetical protein
MQMDLWVPMWTALGASGLTVIGGVAVVIVQRLLQNRDSARNTRERVYVEFHVAGIAMMARLNTMVDVMRFRSGLNNRLEELLRMRRPIDGQELHDWLYVDQLPLYRAWSEVLLFGEPEVVGAANKVMDALGRFAESVINETASKVQARRSDSTRDEALTDCGRELEQFRDYAKLSLARVSARRRRRTTSVAVKVGHGDVAARGVC